MISRCQILLNILYRGICLTEAWYKSDGGQGWTLRRRITVGGETAGSHAASHSFVEWKTYLAKKENQVHWGAAVPKVLTVGETGPWPFHATLNFLLPWQVSMVKMQEVELLWNRSAHDDSNKKTLRTAEHWQWKSWNSLVNDASSVNPVPHGLNKWSVKDLLPLKLQIPLLQHATEAFGWPDLSAPNNGQHSRCLLCKLHMMSFPCFEMSPSEELRFLVI